MAPSIKASALKVGGVEFVDLSGEPTKAKIVRQGFDVPAVRINDKLLEQFVGDLTQIPTKELPRVVSQAIAAGTKVAAGTVVDLVLAPRTKIPFEVLERPHKDLKGKMFDAIDALYADNVAKKTLLSYAAADQVPQAEKAALTQAFQKVGINVDDADANASFDRAFESAQSGLAFQG
jgi:hypothetical protein